MLATRPLAQGALALLALWPTGCGPPRGGTAGAPPPARLLYVANGADGTVTRVDPADDRVVGTPLPAGAAPWQTAVGSTGSMLVLGASPTNGRMLTYVAPSAGTWRARPLALEAGAQPRFLASDGTRYAAVVYAVPISDAHVLEAACRVALVDLRTGTIVRVHRPCADHESITGVALATTATGTTAYLALSRWHEEDGQRWPNRSGQLLALDAETGATRETAPLAGWARRVFVAPAPGGREPRLYCLTAVPGPTWNGRDDEDSWRASDGRLHLLALDPVTLSPQGGREWPASALSLTIAPDGNHAYALAAGGSVVEHVDLTTGAVTPLIWRPSPLLGGLAVTDQHLYVTNVLGSELWVFDRDRGQLLKRVRVGLHPVGIAAASDRA